MLSFFYRSKLRNVDCNLPYKIEKKILQPFPYNFCSSSVCTHDLKENQICVCKESAHNFKQIICYRIDKSYLSGLYTLYSRNVSACTNMMVNIHGLKTSENRNIKLLPFVLAHNILILFSLP